jgi:hypothetical protein
MGLSMAGIAMKPVPLALPKGLKTPWLGPILTKANHLPK